MSKKAHMMIKLSENI
jgi:hypothetical protein